MVDKSPKEQLSALIKDILSRSKPLSQEQVAKKVERYYSGFTHDRFVSHYVRTDRFPQNYDLDEVLAVVRVLAEISNETQRCQAEEAVQIFRLTGMKLEDYQELAKYFPQEEYQQAWKAYLATVSPPHEPTPPPFSLPPYPRLFIGREQDVAALEDRLGVKKAFSQRQPITVIRGWPGVGKTTLVQHLVHDRQIRSMFPEGLLWGSVGDRGKVYSTFKKWGRELGLFHLQNMTTAEEVMDELRRHLWGKKILIVVDDIWTLEDGIYVSQLATPDTTLVLTTRFTDLALRWAASPTDVYKLPVLDETAALKMLGKLAPSAVAQYPELIKRLIKTLEGLPLALRVAGSYLHQESQIMPANIPALIEELQANFTLYASGTVEDRMNEETGITPTIGLLFQRSVETLTQDEQDAFAVLGVFAPKPATFDLTAMAEMWEVDDPLPYIRTLVGRGLLEPVESINGRFQMHYTLAMYANSLLSD